MDYSEKVWKKILNFGILWSGFTNSLWNFPSILIHLSQPSLQQILIIIQKFSFLTGTDIPISNTAPISLCGCFPHPEKCNISDFTDIWIDWPRCVAEGGTDQNLSNCCGEVNNVVGQVVTCKVDHQIEKVLPIISSI